METADSVLLKIVTNAHESEILEFKDRKNLDKDEMGKYFSALSNEANLRNKESAWMVFGVTDDGKLVNSNYLDTAESQNRLKLYISEQTTNRLSYREIHTRVVDNNRILLFEIPPSRFGVPTAFKGIAYERQGDGTIPLTDEKRMRIMFEGMPDWSGKPVQEATIDDLDPDAISLARDLFARNRPTKASECGSWDDWTFMRKIGLTSDGKLTNAAIVLFGKEESSHLLGDVSVGIRRIYRASDRTTIESEIYGLPFLLSLERICSEIHNVRYELFRGGAMGLERMDTYDPALIREALNNCIAHQDYLRSEYITVVEQDRESITFSNAGMFIPDSVEKVLDLDQPVRYYRNKCLAEAMFRLGMVDIAGGGIIRMYMCQMRRLFPLPEYDISGDHVSVRIMGKVVNRIYSDILLNNPDITFGDVVLLDMLQKGRVISEEDSYRLISKGYASGRYPDIVLGGTSVRSTDTGRTIQDLASVISDFILENGPVSRSQISDHISCMKPEGMSDKSWYQKISNTLTHLRESGDVVMEGSRRSPIYTSGRS